MNSNAQSLLNRAHTNPDRDRLLAQREKVMRSYGWDPAQKTEEARQQALKAFSHRK